MTTTPGFFAINRSTSYGEDGKSSLADRFGSWLSARRINSIVGSLEGKDVADIGCGYHAKHSEPFIESVRSLLLVDLKLSPLLASRANVKTVEAPLPEGLANVPDEQLDFILCNDVIEHLWQPQAEATLERCFRLLRPGGTLFVNVPSWRGKYFLELAAFKLGAAPALEMNDHKMYYDPRDLWPKLVRAGFRPQDIRIGRHKFGLNTFSAFIRT